MYIESKIKVIYLTGHVKNIFIQLMNTVWYYNGTIKLQCG